MSNMRVVLLKALDFLDYRLTFSPYSFTIKEYFIAIFILAVCVEFAVRVFK